MKRLLPLALFFAGLFLAGCATSAKLNQISVGMSREQVVTIMGTPDSKSAQGDIEYYTYYLTADGGEGRDQPYMIRFQNGKVESFGRYSQLLDLQYRPVNGQSSVMPGPMGVPIYRANPSSDIASQIQRLKLLHDQGALTDEEFQRAKEKALAEAK